MKQQRLKRGSSKGIWLGMKWTEEVWICFPDEKKQTNKNIMNEQEWTELKSTDDWTSWNQTTIKRPQGVYRNFKSNKISSDQKVAKELNEKKIKINDGIGTINDRWEKASWIQWSK